MIAGRRRDERIFWIGGGPGGVDSDFDNYRASIAAVINAAEAGYVSSSLTIGNLAFDRTVNTKREIELLRDKKSNRRLSRLWDDE